MSDIVADKELIKAALATCGGKSDFSESVTGLLAAMDYASDKHIPYEGNAAGFIKKFAEKEKNEHTKRQKDFCKHVQRICALFQLTDDELSNISSSFLKDEFDKSENKSFLFFTVELKQSEKGCYSRSKYADWTRVINQCFGIPTIVLFRCQDSKGRARITFSFVGRRQHKRDDRRSVLQTVSLLREIDAQNPHRGHWDILYALKFTERLKWIKKEKREKNFDSLLAAWLDELDSEELNKRFYRDLEEWFQHAVQHAIFPLPSSEKEQERVIRLINRMLFIWFLKEKGLVAEQLFEYEQIKSCLRGGIEEGGDNYYRAVLQNLFFATLNTEISERRFSKKNSNDHRNPALYRYKDLIADEKQLMKYFSQTPFVNGGLFECLDDFEGVKEGGKRVDCFTDNESHRKQLFIPNSLFFGGEEQGGLFSILRKYRFVVEENTPIEQEVALDPELLGKVYERLLGHVNRGELGAYYTPRTVVDYMVREVLSSYFSQGMGESLQEKLQWRLQEKLQRLLTADTDYESLSDDEKLSESEIKSFVEKASELKLLDPAVGSGAFLLGTLTQLTMALMRIDPKNKILYAQERERAKAFQDNDNRKKALNMVEKRFSKENKYNNYARKLMLIKDCLFGVDISPAAAQICRLRFFISLAIEQEMKNNEHNYGIETLPNLDARIIAADTLMKITPPGLFDDDEIKKLKRELKKIKDDYFSATSRREKRQCIDEDRKKRKKLSDYLKEKNYPIGDAEKISQWDWDDQTTVAEWFDAQWMFGMTGGFDVVIGNPPYIQLEANDGELAERYRRIGYDGQISYDVFHGKGDIYYLFYERGRELFSSGGHLIYITSNKYMRVGSGKKLRKFLRTKTTLKTIIDFGELPVFEAGTDPAILLMQNKPGVPNAQVRAAVIKEESAISNISEAIEENGFPIKVSNLLDTEWTLAEENVVSLVDKMKRKGRALEVYLRKTGGKHFYGIKTGLNKAFVIDEQTKQQLIKNDPNSTQLIKPYLSGGEIKCWDIEREGKYIIFTTLKTDINKYPAIKNHLDNYINLLKGRRSPEQDYWYALQSPPVHHTLFKESKIVYGETSLELHSYIDEQGLYVNNTAFVIFSKYKEYLLGIMNSELMDFYYRHTFPTLGDPWNPIKRGRIRFRGTRMESMPIVEVGEPRQQPIVECVKKILADPTSSKVTQWEAEINQRVYELYGLTADEIALVKEWQAKRKQGGK